MPKDSNAVCECDVLSRNGITTITTRNSNYPIILIAQTNGVGLGSNKNSGSGCNNTINNGTKQQQHLSSTKKQHSAEEPNLRGALRGNGQLTASNNGNGRASEMGSVSSVATEQSSRSNRRKNKGKKTNSSRRTRSAERAESHYTYIGNSEQIKLFTRVYNQNVLQRKCFATQYCIAWTFLRVSLNCK